MNPRFLVRTKTAIALVFVFSMTAAPSTAPPRNCFAPGYYPLNKLDPATGQPLCSINDTTVVCRMVACPSQTQSDGTSDGQQPPQANPPKSTSPGNNHHGGGGDGLGLLFGALAATIVAGTAIAADQGSNLHLPKPEELDADGPRFPSRPVVGGFQVKGYAAAGWPFAVDIYTQPGTWTWLEVQYEHQRQPLKVNLSRPGGGRHVEVIRLPGDNSSIQVARYSLHSALLPPGGRATDMPMIVYGIGAGPNAVGSVELSAASLPRSGPLFWPAALPRPARGLFNLAAAQGSAASLYLAVTQFGPTPAAGPGGVRWSVTAGRQFPRTLIEVLRYPDQSDRNGKFTKVAQGPVNLLLQTQVTGLWSGLPMIVRVGRGQYRLQARAWRTRAEGGDWTGASSPSDVSIQ